MNRRSILYLVLLVMLAVPVAPGTSFGGVPVEKAVFHDAMRSLWEAHITWTRLYIVSAVADLPDKGPVTDRLMKNQSDIGDAVKPFYGEAAGVALTSLLKEHIAKAADVVTAAKSKDKARLDDATARWRANADEIAAFLTAANPANWPAAEMKSMMREHLDLTTAEVVARLQSDWVGDIAAYERVHTQIMHMADMLSDGIIAQFPKQFNTPRLGSNGTGSNE